MEIFFKIIENRNFVPKIASIMLAVILWAYISSEKSGDVKFKLPVTFTGLEDNYVVSKISHKVAVVEVHGNKDDLKNISSKNFKLVVDVSKTVPGEYRAYPLQYQKIDVTDEFQVELYPDEVKILIEKKITRNVKIIPKYGGYTAKGFMPGKIRLNPEYVKISGPASFLDSIGAIYTDQIPVNEKNASFQQDIKIMKLNEEVLEYNLSRVNASVPVLNYSERAVFEIPVAIKNQKKGFIYTINYSKVKISVILPENKNAGEQSFSAYIDADEIEMDANKFLNKNKIEVMGFVHVIGDSPEADNGILSTTPDIVEIVVTKE